MSSAKLHTQLIYQMTCIDYNNQNYILTVMQNMEEQHHKYIYVC